MEGMTIQIDIGSLNTFHGTLQFKFIVRDSGDAHLQLYASDPSDMRKSGVLFTLNEDLYQRLKDLIEKTDQTIDRLRAAGQMKIKSRS